MELVTDLRLKYKRDIFFSTRVKLILFHIFWVLVIIVVTTALISYVRRLTLGGVVEALQRAITTGTVDGTTFEQVEIQSISTVFYMHIGIIVLTILLGIVATRIALQPVRKALIMQKRFIASIAHELRTPLAVLKTQNEVAQIDVKEDEVMMETIRDNLEEVDRMNAILDNLLLFNRVDTSESINFGQVNLNDIFESILDNLERMAKKKGVELDVETKNIPEVYGNATAIEQMMFNLIKNGIVYTQRGGKVTATCTEVTNWGVTLIVADTGIGIARKDLIHIFEPFYRTPSGIDAGNGSGLGLAIVFEIIKLHDGRITVESSKNSGSKFTVTLPRKPGSVPIDGATQKSHVRFGFIEDGFAGQNPS